MPASMRIDQAGLSAGSASRSRDDGLDTGALVTLTSLGHVSTFRFRLLWVGQHPNPDTTSVSTLTQVSSNTYTFSPTAGVYGTWRIELITDEGSRFEAREVRTFAIKERVGAIRIPAANEQSNASADLVRSNADYINGSENNKLESRGAFASGTYVSYWKSLADVIYLVNDLSASGGSGSGGGGGGASSLQDAYEGGQTIVTNDDLRSIVFSDLSQTYDSPLLTLSKSIDSDDQPVIDIVHGPSNFGKSIKMSKNSAELTIDPAGLVFSASAGAGTFVVTPYGDHETGTGTTIHLVAQSSISGTGGEIGIFAGAGTIGGGHIEINAGSSTEGYGGFINLYGGSSDTDAGGYVALHGGHGISGDGGNVLLEGGSGVLSGGNVILRAGAGTPDGAVKIIPNANNQPSDFVFVDSSEAYAYVGFRAPTVVASSVVWTLPGSDGTGGQVLGTDGAGLLVWSDVVTSSLQSLQTTYEAGRTINTTDAAGPLFITDVDLSVDAPLLHLSKSYFAGYEPAIHVEQNNVNGPAIKVSRVHIEESLDFAANELAFSASEGNSTFTIWMPYNLAGPETGSHVEISAQTSDDGNGGSIRLRAGGGGNEAGFIRILRDDNNVPSRLVFEDTLADDHVYVGFQAPDVILATTVWKLPEQDGIDGQVLVTDGAGALSWANAGGSGIGDYQIDEVANIDNTTTALHTLDLSGVAPRRSVIVYDVTISAITYQGGVNSYKVIATFEKFDSTITEKDLAYLSTYQDEAGVVIDFDISGETIIIQVGTDQETRCRVVGYVTIASRTFAEA